MVVDVEVLLCEEPGSAVDAVVNYVFRAVLQDGVLARLSSSSIVGPRHVKLALTGLSGLKRSDAETLVPAANALHHHPPTGALDCRSKPVGCVHGYDTPVAYSVMKTSTRAVCQRSRSSDNYQCLTADPQVILVDAGEATGRRGRASTIAKLDNS